MEQVSFFRPPISNVIPEPEPMTLREVWEYIRGDRAKYWTERLRETGDESIKKNKLDFVTFGGVFDYRITDAQVERDSLLERLGRGENLSEIDRRKLKLLEGKKGLISPSGLVTIDIDHVSRIGRDIRELRDELLQDEELGLRLIFISPRGDGLKLVCKSVWNIDTPEDFKDEAFSLLGYIHETHKIPYYVGEKGEKEKILDKDCTDIPRSCLLCHDPESVLVDSPGFNSQEHYFPEQEVREEMDKEKGIKTQKPKRTLPQGIVSSDWTDFVERKLLPAMFERIDEIFPEMDFHFKGRIWESPRKLDGSPAKSPRREKTIAYGVGSPYFGTIYEHGGDGVGYIDLYMQKTGLSFPEARKELSRICGLEEEELELRRKTAEDLNKDRRTTNTMTNKETPTGEEKVPQTEKFAYFLTIPDLSELAKEKREGIETDYLFEKFVRDKKTGTMRPKREKLVLRSGALTLVCGKSSHGKSKFIQNLALQLSVNIYNSQSEESVLFLTYDEELSDVLLQFANMFVGERELSQYDTPNIEVLRDYYETGTLNKCPESKRTNVLRRLQGFNQLRGAGTLRVFYTDFYSQGLTELIRFLSSQMKLKAVFVDYAQLLYREGNRKDRNQELKDICNDLRTCAIDTGLPIVLAAQFNRQTPNPLEMSEDNIADSADLTRYANTILCLWNSSFDNVSDKSTFTASEDYKIKLFSRGFDLGQEGKIYGKITKNRGGTSHIDAVLDFEGETGRVFTNKDQESKSPTKWNK